MREVVENYMFICDRCECCIVDEVDFLPGGWEKVDEYDLCDDCFLEYEIAVEEFEEDETEFCIEDFV